MQMNIYFSHILTLAGMRVYSAESKLNSVLVQTYLGDMLDVEDTEIPLH